MKEIPLSKGYVALVDDADYERVIAAGPWHAHVCEWGVYAGRYVRQADENRQSSMSRFILGITTPKIEVDHRDRNGLNNQRANLRICTRRRNNRNRYLPTRSGKPTSSPYKGVRLKKGRKNWEVTIYQGQSFFCGCFSAEIDAALAYDQKAEQLFGEFAWLNRNHFPEVMAAYEASQTAITDFSPCIPVV